MGSSFSNDDIRAYYSDQAGRLSRQYEQVSFERIHAEWSGLIPAGRLNVLDVGAGSGRDAAWFAARGDDVVAVEPAESLRNLARELHPAASIHWLDDTLPDLPRVGDLGRTYDLVLLSAVWMHLSPEQRLPAFARLVEVLATGGIMVISLRHGPDLAERLMYPTSAEELRALGQKHQLTMRGVFTSADELGRSEISWTTVVFERGNPA